MKRITIDLPEEIYRELKIRCAMGGITMSNVVRELLEKNLRGKSMDPGLMEAIEKRALKKSASKG
jgi:plasmid stability protein